MRAEISPRALGWLIGTAALLALPGGVAFGARLGEAASRPRVEEIRVADPTGLAPTSGIDSRSPGGFSGFGGPPALEGEVLRRGTSTGVRAGAFAIVDGTATTSLEFTQPSRLYRLAPSSAPLAVGENVVVRHEDGRAVAVLRVR